MSSANTKRKLKLDGYLSRWAEDAPLLRVSEGEEMYKYTHETVVDSDIKSTFDWFEHEGSFRRLMPPWEVAEKSVQMIH